MMTLDEYHDAIRSREDFVAFVQALSRDLHTNRETWENDTLERFLEALCAWVEDMDGYYVNQGKPIPQQPDWKVLGDILMAATVYE
ncbi:DUF7660 family protein [Bradyrhizobium sp. McL0615]|uniref:DUF7660 family protein n=1 Tax=Bradyrhizobium sp. McL0615 TaxID=3415673 RepID=UPI003CE8B9DE